MTTRQEFAPGSAVIDAVIKDAVAPVVKRCEESLNKRLFAEIVIVRNGIEQIIETEHEKEDDTSARGKIRLTFRKTFHENKYRFHVESIYHDLQSSKGFSGFAITGRIIHNSVDDIVVETNGGAYRHNVWEWQGW